MPVPEERRGATPGVFAPQCMTHEAFTDNTDVFQMRMAGMSYHDTVWNWWTGAQPQVVIRPFTGTVGARMARAVDPLPVDQMNRGGASRDARSPRRTASDR